MGTLKGVRFLSASLFVAVGGYVILGDNVWVVAVIGFCGAMMVYQGDDLKDGPVVEYVKRD